MESTKTNHPEGAVPGQGDGASTKPNPPQAPDEPIPKEPAIELTDVIEEKASPVGAESEPAPSGAVAAEAVAGASAPSGEGEPSGVGEKADTSAPGKTASDAGERADAAPSVVEPAAQEEPEEIEIVEEPEQVAVVDEVVPPPESLADRLAKKEEELSRLQDRFLRLAADFDNYKKRVAKDRAETLKFGNESLARQLLDVGDNLERALAHAENSDKQALLDGVGLVQNIFLQTLEKFGIKRFSAMGQAFDPSMQEAIQEVESDDLPAGAVVFELHKGYTYHERLLRPARVVLSRGPSTPVKRDAEEEVSAAETAAPAEDGEAATDEKQDKANR